ncbi:MAG: zf-HC2 domain-containing protein [Candidatus Aminicenantes bacterium]|nr:zf-HC2 domain-containing protein [Candidatus Aminicenantes bacterium]
MSCPRISDLYEYLDGGMSPQKVNNIEGHLRVCPRCRRAVEERRLIAAAASSLAPFDVPEDFPERVMSRLPGSQPRSRGWLAALAAGTSVLTLILVVMIASGKSGLEFMKGAGGTFWESIKTIALITAKAASFVSLVGRTLRTLLEAGVKGLSLLTSFVPPGAQVFILVVVLGVLATFFYGMRKKLSTGDQR